MKTIDDIKSILKLLNTVLLSVLLIVVLIHIVPNVNGNNLISMEMKLNGSIRTNTEISGEIANKFKEPYGGIRVDIGNWANLPFEIKDKNFMYK
jgi:hypothetical protein